MKLRFTKFGEGTRVLELPDTPVTIADVLRISGEDPSNLHGSWVGLVGELGEARLDRPVAPDEHVMLIPNVKGG